MYLRQIEEARALATPVTQNITATDTDPAIVIQYVPALGTGGTAATIALATGSQTLTFTVDSSAPAELDAIGGASGALVLTDAVFDTMGELVDYINGRSAWRAYLVGALRSDNPTNLLVKSAASCIGDNGLTFYSDTSTNLGISLAISGEKFVNNGINGHVKDFEDECENEMLYGSFNVTCASAPYLSYYTGKQGSTETLITAAKLLTSASGTLEGEEIPTGPFIQATRGQRLIMRCVSPSVANATPVTAGTITVVGKTAVLKNDRIVSEQNWS